MPVRLALTTGEAPDNRLVIILLSALKSVCQPAWRVGKHPAKAEPEGADLLQSYLCRARNLVERFVNKINQCRRVATRYDKFAANYLAFIQ